MPQGGVKAQADGVEARILVADAGVGGMCEGPRQPTPAAQLAPDTNERADIEGSSEIIGLSPFAERPRHHAGLDEPTLFQVALGLKATAEENVACLMHLCSHAEA